MILYKCLVLLFAVVNCKFIDPILIEDDMILSPTQYNAWYNEGGYFHGRSLKGLDFAWKDAVVPYVFSPQLDEEQKKIILGAMKVLEDKTCVRFREAVDSDEYKLHIQNDKDGCFSEVGFQKRRKQIINLSKHSCFKTGTIIHEFLHTLSFFHEQSAEDRDEYVKVNFENIIPEEQYNFRKHVRGTNVGVPYDYNSLTHYRSKAFSKNGKPTIVSLTHEKVPELKPTKLSEKDILRLNLLYKCMKELHLLNSTISNLKE